jgi:hypothetical protein
MKVSITFGRTDINISMNELKDKPDWLLEAAQRLLEEKAYSEHAPVSKLKRLKASVKSIPDENLDYVLQVIAAHVNNKQLEEIISVLK